MGTLNLLEVGSIKRETAQVVLGQEICQTCAQDWAHSLANLQQNGTDGKFRETGEKSSLPLRRTKDLAQRQPVLPPKPLWSPSAWRHV